MRLKARLLKTPICPDCDDSVGDLSKVREVFHGQQLLRQSYFGPRISAVFLYILLIEEDTISCVRALRFGSWNLFGIVSSAEFSQFEEVRLSAKRFL